MSLLSPLELPGAHWTTIENRASWTLCDTALASVSFKFSTQLLLVTLGPSVAAAPALQTPAVQLQGLTSILQAGKRAASCRAG